MTREEIKKLILCRAYAGAFEEGIEDTFNLHTYTAENRIDNDEAWKAFEELRADGLIDYYACGGILKGSSRGLAYCENHKLVDEKLIDYQNKIRTKLLVTLADIQDRSPHGEIADWEEWIQEAGVSGQDFKNNDHFLQDFGLIKHESTREYTITSYGMERVRDYRKRKKRLEDFERLEKLEGVTKQERGHKLEDLLADSAEWEGWEVNRRVRAQGQEIDIILHVGLHYFLSSCKWEAEPLLPKEVELLESRVRSRATANGGIIFSLSGFTDNCIEEIRMKVATALIIPFGSLDIRRIMQNEISLTDLIDDKIDHVMNHRKILVDGELK